MSLRLKLVLALVALSTGATVAVGGFTYRTTRTELLSEIDRSLATATASYERGPRPRPDDPGDRGPDLRDRFRGQGDVLASVVTANGQQRALTPQSIPIQPESEALLQASPSATSTFTATVGDERYRVLATNFRAPARGELVLQTARSLAEVERVLATLRTRIIVAGVIIAAAAAAIGALLARQFTRRLEALTAAAEQVGATGQLDVQVPAVGNDEAGRLGESFNAMLAALSESRSAQQRLVQDAGHELRTPLTSLRTNVFALRRSDALSPDDRVRLLDDLESETEELTALVNEVVEVATDRRTDEPWVLVDLGALVDRVAARSSKRSDRVVLVTADHSQVVGRPRELERIVSNLVENAIKFDESGGPIDVSVAAGAVEVADRGPGFDDRDLPRVFDRFYRSDAARSRPGSGLGLSIVHDLVAAHGGTVAAANRPGGGAVVRVEFPPPPAGPAPLSA
ncbi:MAG: HAMP domain-containing sensor histidine kinase [Microthrixaceae bacterium]